MAAFGCAVLADARCNANAMPCNAMQVLQSLLLGAAFMRHTSKICGLSVPHVFFLNVRCISLIIVSTFLRLVLICSFSPSGGWMSMISLACVSRAYAWLNGSYGNDCELSID